MFRNFKSSQHGNIHPKNRNPILAHLCKFQNEIVLHKTYGTKWGVNGTCWGIYWEVGECVGNSVKTWWVHSVNLMGTQVKTKKIQNPSQLPPSPKGKKLGSLGIWWLIPLVTKNFWAISLPFLA
jgi:hypothetical protein